MKKLLFAVALALVMMAVSAPAVFAWGGENADVAVSPITIDTGGNPLWVGYGVTASGTVTIVADASAGGALFALAVADSSANFSISDPSSVVIAAGSSGVNDVGVGGFWVVTANADAGQTFAWSSTFTPTEPGWYAVYQDGAASAWYLTFLPNGFGSDSDFVAGTYTFWVSQVPSGCVDPTGGLTDKFIVLVNAGYYIFTAPWVEKDRPWIYGRTLAEDLNADWQLCWGGQMHKLHLFIPAGTEIHGLADRKAYFMEVVAYQGSLYFPKEPYLSFSQPVVVTDTTADGRANIWVFDQLVGGKPVLSPGASVVTVGN